MSLLDFFKKKTTQRAIRKALKTVVFTMDNREELAAIITNLQLLRDKLRDGRLDSIAALVEIDALYNRLDALYNNLKTAL